MWQQAGRLTAFIGKSTDWTSWIIAGASIGLAFILVAELLSRLSPSRTPVSEPLPPAAVEGAGMSVKELTKRAEMYAKGKGVLKSETEAAKWYRRAAEQGDAEAQCQLGLLVAKNQAEALRWWRKAADQNYPLGQALLGVAYAEGVGVGKDEVEAVNWYRKAAEQNSAAGQLMLGTAYEKGRGIPKDEAEAVIWYRKAAEQNDAPGQNELGKMYSAGRGVPKDEAEAALWYQKAAEKNMALAQYNLGMLYAKGKIGMIETKSRNGISYSAGHYEKDYVQAHIWLNLAGANGNEDARREINTVESTMTPSEKAEASTKAGELFAKIRGAADK